MSGKNLITKYLSNLSDPNISTLRYAIGATLAMAFAMGFDWSLSYLAPVLALSFLSSPAGRTTFKQGFGFVFIIAVACFLAIHVGKLLIPYPFVFIPFVGLLLFRIYYAKGSSLPQIMILWLLIALLVIPLIMMYEQTLSEVIAIGLITSGTVALISTWIAFTLLPDDISRKNDNNPASKQEPPTKEERFRMAVESTIVVFPVLIIFYMFQLAGSLLILIYIALLSMQPQFAKDFKSGKALIIGNAIGGIAALIVYEVLVIVPELYFLLLITLLTGLIFGAKLFSGNPRGALFGMAYSTLLLIIGSVTGSSGEEAGSEIYTRILQIMSAVVYLVLAFGLLEHLKKLRKEKRLLKMKKKILPAVMFFLFISGCSLGPDYVRPPSVTETAKDITYQNEVPSGESIANLPWWEVFGDTVLQNLLNEALANNRNLRIAIARIEEARATLNIVRADLYPKVDYSAGGSYDETFGENSSGSGSGSVMLDASYQVDLWGRVARSNEAAIQQLLATEEAYRSITIALVAEVASAYLLLRDIDNRLLIAENTAETRRKSLDVIKAKYEAGIVAEVDVNQSEIQLADAEASVKSFNRLRGQTGNAINLLLSRPPQHIERGLTLNQQIFPPDIPVGLPSELLDRRPDLLEAERNLHAQTARIGVAEALKYPQLNLNANIGAEFTNLTSLFASLGTQLFGPLFNAGANQSRVDVEIARTRQLLNNYEQTFYTALREVEDALIAVRTYKEEYEIRRNQVKSAKNAVELSWIRYESGMTSYLEVLDVQRSLFAAELKASETLQLELTSIITLYKALGGGWDAEQDTFGYNVDKQKYEMK